MTTARLRAVLWGSDALPPAQVEAMLTAAGFSEVRVQPPTGAGLTPILARR